MTLAEFIAELESVAGGSGYTVVPQEAFSSSVAVGQIISVDPPVGTLVVPDEVITVVVSKGPFPASRWTGATPEITQAAVVSADPSAPPAIVKVTLVYMDFEGDPTYVCDAGANINWGGHEWIGLGSFGTIEGPTESLDAIAQPFRLTLSGVDASIVAKAMDTETIYAGRSVEVYTAILHPHTYALLDTPTELVKGYMSVMTIEVDQNSGSIVLECENRLRRLPSTRRWTDEDQRSRYSTDKFFEFTHFIRGYVSGAGGGSITYSGPGRNRERDNPRPN